MKRLLLAINKSLSCSQRMHHETCAFQRFLGGLVSTLPFVEKLHHPPEGGHDTSKEGQREKILMEIGAGTRQRQEA